MTISALSRTAVVTFPNGQWRRRRALTLAELLVATILASMLMVALVGVLPSMTRAQRVLQQKGPQDRWQARFVHILERDLRNSQTIRTTTDGVYLEGLSGRDSIAGSITHCPAVIHYAVVEQGDRWLLIRDERSAEENAIDCVAAEVVAVDLEQIFFTHASSESPPLSEQSAEAVIQDGPLPWAIRVVAYSAADEGPVFDRSFILR